MAEDDDNSERKVVCLVDWKFLPLKMHFFLLCGAHVGVTPYLPVFAKSRLGLSATSVGILSTCMQFSTALSKPAFGFFADYTNKMNALIVGLICSEVLLILFILGIPAVDSENRFVDPGLQDAQKELSTHKCENIFSAFDEKGLPWDTAIQNRTAWTNKTLPHYSGTEPETNYSNRSNHDSQLIQDSLPDNYTFDHDIILTECSLHCPTLIHKATCFWENKSCMDVNATQDFQCKFQYQNTDERYKRPMYFNVSYTLQNYDSTTAGFTNKFLPQRIIIPDDNVGSSTRICNVSASECIFDCKRNVTFCLRSLKPQEIYNLSFWIFVVCAILSVMCQGALYSLSDTVCYENVKNTSTSYGSQRFFGALGWGLMAPISGFLNGLAPEQSQRSYSPGFYMMAGLSMFLLLNTFNIKMKRPKYTLSEADNTIKSIFLSKEFLCVEICILSSGILNAYTSNYIAWYLESLGSSQLLIGMTLSVECIFGEAIFMYFSQTIISKFGHWNVFTLSFIVFSVRFTAYYLLQNVWMVLPIEILHGITFGLFYITVTSYAKEISNPKSEATIQGVFGGTFQGLGTGFGTLIAGILFDKYGGRMAFLMAAIFSCFAALFTSIVSIFLIKEEPKVYEFL